MEISQSRKIKLDLTEESIVLIYCVRAYLFDADILLRSRSVPVDVPNEFAQSRTNFVHLGEGIICLVMSVVRVATV